MTLDFSFGIIPYHKETKRFLIIQHTKDHWSFPKGHPEKNEMHTETAVRELFEETGLTTISIDPREFKEEYTFIHNGEAIHKTVTYFIGFIESVEVIIQEKEVKDFAWLTFEEALSQITFDNTLYLAKEAHAYLKTSSQL